MRVELKKLAEVDAYCAWDYTPFAAAMSGYAIPAETRRVFAFKKHGKRAEEVRRVVEAVAKNLRCDCIVAVPGHTVEPTQLQRLFDGGPVRFQANGERAAKKFHHKTLDGERARVTLLAEGEPPHKILLVDDVLKTGLTLTTYADWLRGSWPKCKVVPFALAARDKLPKRSVAVLDTEPERASAAPGSGELLLTLLARTDAVFWPMRCWRAPGCRAFFIRRRAFLRNGLPWASEGATEGERKAAQRELEAADEAGLVDVFRGRGERAFGVRLTDKADDATRQRIGLVTFAEALALLDELYRRRTAPDGFDGLGCGTGGFPPWTSERALTGVKWGDDKNRGAFPLLAEDMFPLLVRGLVQSNADLEGRCWYALTVAGFQLAEQRAAGGTVRPWRSWYCAGGEEDADGPPKRDEGAFARYHERRQSEIAAIERTALDEPDLGAVPLPAAPILRKSLKGLTTPPDGVG